MNEKDSATARALLFNRVLTLMTPEAIHTFEHNTEGNLEYENRIKDLQTRREILNQALEDILRDKRKVDKYNMELQDKISGRNVTDEMQKKKYRNEERKMRI